MWIVFWLFVGMIGVWPIVGFLGVMAVFTWPILLIGGPVIAWKAFRSANPGFRFFKLTEKQRVKLREARDNGWVGWIGRKFGE